MKSMGIDYLPHPLSARKDIETQEVRLMVGREPKATLSERFVSQVVQDIFPDFYCFQRCLMVSQLKHFVGLPQICVLLPLVI